MNAAQRLRLTLLALLGGALVVLLAMLAVHDLGTLSQAKALSDRLDKADRERLEAVVAEKSLQVLQPQAVLVDGRRGEFLAGVQAAADQPGLKAWAAGAAARAPLPAKKGRKAPKPAAAPPMPGPALDAVAQPMQGVWSSALLIDKNGHVMSEWPLALPGKPSAIGADFSKDPIFKDASQGPGLPYHTFTKVMVAAAPIPVPAPTPVAKNTKAKPGAPKPAPAKPAAPMPHASAMLVAGCGIEGADGGFGGLLLVRANVKNVLLADAAAGFEPLLQGAPRSVALLLRGNGDELWHSAKDPFTENLGSINPEYKGLLAAVAKAPSGRQSVSSYDGQPGVLAWQRVGAAPEGAAPESMLTLATFVPQTAFSAGAAAGVEPLKAFYKRPGVLLLLLLALLLPYLLGAAWLPKALEPYRISAEQARRVEEYSPIPELALPEEQDDDAQAINRGLSVLAKRATQGEERVRELDNALRRVEEQAGKDATQAAMEISSLREKAAATEAGRQAADAKFEAAQKARQEAESQLGNLRSALETATRNTELKATENRNLSTQVQDLMRALEEQRKVAEKAQESVARKESEVVRLAAVNTLSSELKATLTVIKNYISTMLGSQGAISDAQQEFLGVVINKSARLERLIGDLVELSEIGSGVKPLRLESVSASALVQEALVNARPQAEHKKISLELAEGVNLSPVQVDREKIGAVLRSLLSQAIKVTSRNEKIGLLLSERESTVELRVTDPGMSLPPDRASKVFTMFHGVDSQAGPEFIGTGLRFPILKSVVEAHGGKIWIESQVGRGKTFVVAMPKTGAAAPPATLPAPAAPPMMAPPIASAPAALAPPPAAKPTSLPPVIPSTLAGLPPLGPPPIPSAGSGQALPPMGVPPLPLPPVPSSVAPKPATAPPVIHKPAPMDDSLNAPWKRKDAKDELEETMDLPPLPIPKASGGIPSLPPLASAVIKTEAKPSDADQSDFDKVFGAPPVQAEEKRGGLPKVELKTDAKPNDDDMAKFAALFGSGAAAGSTPPPPPPGLGAPPPPPPGAMAGMDDFAKIFPSTGSGQAPSTGSGQAPSTGSGQAPSTGSGQVPLATSSVPPVPPKGATPLPPPGLGAPPPPPPGAMAGMDDFAAIFGGAPAPAVPIAPAMPPRSSVPPVPPALPTGLGTPPPVAVPKPALPGAADFDAIFGPSAGSGQAPSAGSGQVPSAGSGQVPSAPATPPKPPTAPGGGMNSLDDLNTMLGN